VAKIVTALNLKILPRDLRSKDSRQLLSTIFTQWLSLSTCIIQATIDVVPSPPVAQAIRIPKMLYPNIFDKSVQPKNKLEQDLFTSNFAPDAVVVAYVSKMFAVAAKELPENKKRAVTADELCQRVRDVKETRDNSTSVSEIPDPPRAGPESPPSTAPRETSDVSESEIILGFARLYSGTIHTGSTIYCVLPKYNASLPPNHAHNVAHLIPAKVEGLYVMMGRELIPVDSVRAGNTFAIRGLGGKVYRNATLCAPQSIGVPEGTDPIQIQDSLINIGGVTRTVSVTRVFGISLLIIGYIIGIPYSAGCA
jgi:ribosome assembly protein 1